MDKKYIPSYGRKRAHGMSSAQKIRLINLYEKYGIQVLEPFINPPVLFDNEFKDIIVEIGFGGGEHLIENAKRNPDLGFIGCDIFENGIANCLNKIESNKINNIRIYNGDARVLLDSFGDNSVSMFYILFPDPWPKKRHHKRRLLSADFIGVLIQKLKRNCGSVIATDCKEYNDDILSSLNNSTGIQLISNGVEKPSCFVSTTKYEEKALSRGEKPYYTYFTKENVVV